MDWIGVMETPQALRLWRFEGVHARAMVTLAPGMPVQPMLEDWGLGAAPVVRAGAPGPDRALPCRPLQPPFPVNAPQVGRPQALDLPGLVQHRPWPDTLSAEVIELAGFMALVPDFDGVLVLCDDGPTRWVHLSAGEAISMASSAAPTLLGAPPETGPGFADALERLRARPEQVALALSGGDVATRSGALVGAELAATRALWLGQPVALRGDGAWTHALETGLAAQGAMLTRGPRAPLAPAGFVAAAKQAGVILS